MDLFTVKERLKLILLFVGIGLFLGVFATWHAWRQTGPGGVGAKIFLLSATVMCALAVAWTVLLVSFFITKRAMKPSPIDKQRWLHARWWSNIPWRVLKYMALLAFIVAMVFVLSWLSSAGANEFTLLEKGKFALLRERISENPGLLDCKEKESGKTLLVLALESGSSEGVELLFSCGADLGSVINGPNWVIAVLSNPPMLETLLHHGANPNAGDTDGYAPIHHALESRNAAALAALLGAGADVNARNPFRQTPLLLAIMANDLPLAQTLFEAGADLGQWDELGDTVLHKAVQRRNMEAIRFFLEKGADPKTFNFANMTPIHIAALNGKNGLVELFLEDPGLVGLSNDDDRTPLDHALRGRHYDTVRLLIEHGAQIDRVMANGYTAIHLMVIAKDYKIVRFLIEEGANVHLAAPDGETALDLMRKKQLQTLLDLVDARDNPDAATNTVEALESL